MTDAAFETYVRSLLNDVDTALLSAAEFVVHKAVAITLVNANFWNLLFPLKKYPLLYSLAAGQNYLDLPVGWHKVVRVEIASTGQALRPIPDIELPDYLNADSGEPAGYAFVRGKVRILPDSASALTDYLRLWFLPRATTLAELPEDLHPLVAVETVIAGRTKDENISPYLTNLRDRYEWLARKALIQFQTQSPLSIPDDFDMD
jgi:hypothetical protein